jgi:hypothetical protein
MRIRVFCRGACLHSIGAELHLATPKDAAALVAFNTAVNDALTAQFGRRPWSYRAGHRRHRPGRTSAHRRIVARGLGPPLRLRRPGRCGRVLAQMRLPRGPPSPPTEAPRTFISTRCSERMRSLAQSDLARSMLQSLSLPEWRNWQTRYVQVVVLAREWGFESLFGHQ